MWCRRSAPGRPTIQLQFVLRQVLSRLPSMQPTNKQRGNTEFKDTEIQKSTDKKYRNTKQCRSIKNALAAQLLNSSLFSEGILPSTINAADKQTNRKLKKEIPASDYSGLVCLVLWGCAKTKTGCSKQTKSAFFKVGGGGGYLYKVEVEEGQIATNQLSQGLSRSLNLLHTPHSLLH